MREKGFGDEYVNRYKMVSKFFQQRRPLVILICGSPCSGEASVLPSRLSPFAGHFSGDLLTGNYLFLKAGKSTLAQALASRLNLPNVLQTDIIHEVQLQKQQCLLAPL